MLNKTEQNQIRTSPPEARHLLQIHYPETEEDSVPKRASAEREITRRTFLSLLGAITGVGLIGWVISQKIGILKSDTSQMRMLPQPLLEYALDNKLSPQQINKLRYFSDRGFNASDSISYFTFSEQHRVELRVFDSIPFTLDFQTYKRYFDYLKESVPSDYLLENLNPIIGYGIEKKFSLFELESLCKSFTQHLFRKAIFGAIRTNGQLIDRLFEDFNEMRKDSIQYYIDVLHEKAKTHTTWDRDLLTITDKIRIMEAIRDYKEVNLGTIVIGKEKAFRLRH